MGLCNPNLISTYSMEEADSEGFGVDLSITRAEVTEGVKKLSGSRVREGVPNLP